MHLNSTPFIDLHLSNTNGVQQGQVRQFDKVLSIKVRSRLSQCQFITFVSDTCTQPFLSPSTDREKLRQLREWQSRIHMWLSVDDGRGPVLYRPLHWS